MPCCGSQAVLCNLPVRFDTYKGCSHLCRYCFTQRKTDLNIIEKNEGVIALSSFIAGQRSEQTRWCDWDIPLHWGGLSDPFQPIELQHRVSYKCLKVFAETQYPFVVSTKGRAIVEYEYLDLLSKCNCVVQMSMVCGKYDELEKGAPTFIERLKMVETLSKRVKRVNIRIQPYMTEVFDDVYKNIWEFSNAGVYGVTVEGMKYAKKKAGLVKVGSDFAYPLIQLQMHFKALKERAHECGMKFYCGENRLRAMGDDMTCCGIDGLGGFTPNLYNVCNIVNGIVQPPTDVMKQVGTAYCFKAIDQTASGNRRLKRMSFHGYMSDLLLNKREYLKDIFGK